MDEAETRKPYVRVPVLILLVILVLISGIYFARRSGMNPNQYSNDFNVYFFAARELLQGRTPYENSLGTSTSYLYPPLLAELLIPEALLPLPVAAYLWFLLSAASLFAAAQMSSLLATQHGMFVWFQPGGTSKLYPAAQNPTLQILVAGITLLILSRFILDNFDYGQVNLIVTALAVAHVYFYTQDRKIHSAITLAFAVALKLTPAILLAYHLAKRRWKFAALSATFCAGLMALSFVPFGSRAPATFEVFYNRTIKNEQGFDLSYHGNQSLRAAIARLKLSDKFDLLGWEIVGGTLFFIALIFVYLYNSQDHSASAPFFCLAVILSPLSWKQHFVILVLPIAFLIGEAIRESNRKTCLLLITVLAVVFVLFNFTSPKLIGIPAAEWCDAHSFVLSGALLLYVVVLLRAMKIRDARRKTH